MNRDQRKKLADVCFNEAVTCALRDDIEDAKELSKLYVKHEFKEEIELIIGGNAELFTTIVKNQYSDSYKNLCKKIYSFTLRGGGILNDSRKT